MIFHAINWIGHHIIDSLRQFLDVEGLKFDLLDFQSVNVSWTCNPNADYYMVDFYDSQNVLEFSTKQYLPCQWVKIRILI